MNRLGASFCALLLSSAAALAAEAAGRFDACALLKKSEIEAVQGDKVVATKASEPERDRFAVSQCFYTLATFSKSISVEVTRRRPGEAEGPRQRWEQMFSRAMRKDDKEEEDKPGEKEREERARPRLISGVGDQAYWDGSTIGGGLYVLQGDAYMRLSVGGPDTQAVKTEKLKKLARKALSRLREKKIAR